MFFLVYKDSSLRRLHWKCLFRGVNPGSDYLGRCGRFNACGIIAGEFWVDGWYCEKIDPCNIRVGGVTKLGRGGFSFNLGEGVYEKNV